MSFTNAVDIAGYLYGAHGPVRTTGAIVAYGGLYAGSYTGLNEVTIHYDRAVVDAAADCPPESGACTSCVDCGNQACVGGVCGACTSSDQCCAPLICSASNTCVLAE